MTDERPLGRPQIGEPDDIPVDEVEDDEPRGIISLLKGIKNYLRAGLAFDGDPVTASNPLPVDVKGIVADVDLDIEASDLGAGAAASAMGNGVTQHLDNGAGKRVAALGDASGHQQVDVLTAPAVRALTNADVVTAEVSKDAVMGTTADGPSTDAEDTTVRTGISLWKGIKNYLKTLAGTVAGSEIQVDVVSMPAITGAVTTSGTVTEASAAAIKTALEIIDDWDTSDHCNIRHLVAADDVVGIGAGTAEIGNVKNTGTFAVQALVPFAAENLVPNATEADQALTVDATAAGVQLAALHANTTHVFWSLETASVRVTFDASTPTTTNGHLLQPGDSGVWSKALAAAAKFIRTGATSGVVSASQMKGA